jgi:phospholipid/cholesterol/gamma-HCH transport system substrate-binding protein
MRRVAATVLLMASVAALALIGTGAADEGRDPYLVRAAFDNGNFIVPGEEVRVAGARVGAVESVDVSGTDEIVSMDPEPRADPGKAIIVLRIDDEAFQDFRQDASCIIRPQSLLGEKFIDCQPTEPRAPGSEPPPPLQPVPEGEPGEGQLLLPVERNGKTVDLDLVNNIMRLPYRQRFSIILNEFGAGLAARGDELGEVIDRANPALRETDRVLAILARQSATLSQLARDSDTVLGPLAREREHVAGFIANAGETAAASAERRADIEAGLARLPPSLRELRVLMRELRGFSDQARPVFADLGGAAPSITGATRALGPLADAATPSLRTLGAAAEEAGPDIRASDPVIKDIRRLGDESERPSRDLGALLRSLRSTGGYDELLSTLFRLSGAINGLDQYGHFLRTQLLVTNCTDYTVVTLSGCEANFIPGAQTSSRALPTAPGADPAPSGGSSDNAADPAGAEIGLPEAGLGGENALGDLFGDQPGLEDFETAPEPLQPEPAPALPETGGEEPDGAGSPDAAQGDPASLEGAAALLRFLMGESA